MPENIYLESKEKLFKYYPSFLVKEKTFSDTRPGKHKGGVPLAYDSDRQRIAIDTSDTHTLIWGSTGSLKTRCVIEPTVKILGKAGESMIINDPKAEIYNRCAAELQEEGYRIIVVNIREPQYGNAWNPLAIPYRFFEEGNLDLASEFANDVANNLILEGISTKEPFWDLSAGDCLFGLILLLFRYCKDHGYGEEQVNMSNVMELRRQLFMTGTRAQYSQLWRYAMEDELIASGLSGTIYAPDRTMSSILSTFDQKMRIFSIRPTLLDMLANNDFDIGFIGKEKCAVFLIIPDEKSTYNSLVSLFVKQAYEYLIYTASQDTDLKLENRVNFVLDEFSSLPPIASMSSIISAARSRDIRFILAVQGMHQLTQRYGGEAETIKSNCGNWIYLTSRELGLLQEISDLCGRQRNHQPNLSVYDLQHFSKNRCEALVLCGRMKPAKVNLLDIDRFGDQQYVILDFEEMPRGKRERRSFELSAEIKERVAPLLKKEEQEMSTERPSKKTKNDMEKQKKISELQVTRKKKQGQLQKVDQILHVINAEIADMIVNGEEE